MQAFRGPRTALVLAVPTFEEVTDYQQVHAYDRITVPLTAGMEHDVARMREVTRRAGRPTVVYFWLTQASSSAVGSPPMLQWNRVSSASPRRWNSGQMRSGA